MLKLEKYIVVLLGVFFSIWTFLYISGFFLVEAGIHRALFIGITLIIGFLTKPLKINYVGQIIDYILIIATVLTFGYYIYFYNELIMRAGLVTNIDVFFTVLVLIILLEAIRRTVSIYLSIIIVAILLHTLLGSKIPFFSTESDFSLERVSSVVFLGNTGIFGIPLDVAATIVFIFVLFGAFFAKSGVGQAFLDLAFGAFG